MNNGGDAAEQIVRLSLEGMEVAAKLSGTAAKHIAVLLVTVLKQEQKTQGKARLTNLIKSGKELKVFSVPQKDLQKFISEAKRYGVLYCVLRDKKNRGEQVPVDIIARAEDASKIQRIVERFELGTVDKGLIVSKAKEEVEEKQENAREVPKQSQEEINKAKEQEKPIQKEENSKENPSTAKTDKNLPSRQNSEQVEPHSNRRGGQKTEKKPSVREKLEQYKVAAKTNQTVHRQPKPKSKDRGGR